MEYRSLKLRMERIEAADPNVLLNIGLYRGSSLIRNNTPLGPYHRPTARALWWS